jgi:pimeloyl-ACP methyl ester carboxylesterase
MLFSAALVSALVLTACNTSTPIRVDPVTYTKVPCRFQPPDDQKEGQGVTCGDLSVPENRLDTNSRRIKLHVAVFKRTNTNSELGPIFLLSGGPGTSIGSVVSGLTGPFKTALQTDHDVVAIEPRGTGYSQPLINCAPELALSGGNDPMLPRSTSRPLLTAAVVKCMGRLKTSGADLRGYNSIENAADINDLRLALGFTKINLAGFSYGTRLALEVERRYPETLRAVVIDSVTPPNESLDLFQGTKPNESFGTVLTNCAKDTACNAAFPNLDAAFSQVVKALDQKPLKLSLSNQTGTARAVLLDGDALVYAILRSLYNRDAAAVLPKLITQLDRGQTVTATSPLNTLADTADADTETGYGLLFNIVCTEGVPFATPANISRPALLRASVTDYSLAQFKQVCQAMDLIPTPKLEAVTSSIPTLLQSGEFDPVTPPSSANLAAATLAKNFSFTYPGSGHITWTSTDGCALGMAAEFLADPSKKPDSSCIAKLGLKFDLP